ncbi:Glycosyl transferase, family 14-containing protein [Strongyloides ratti]|uniref:Glycosyl transferase, family 14-containing protein n=1 Tax=Strongyloides ratti TaxID=34506 RepID=A0A090LPX7_STRRB|nr:Glycosyl transferase, family 14-containing protein [Strongyloides ratti]CEF69606.1 Glycosyl transferase, family 14-containing protein [Strongyloides ratti]
MKFIFKYYVFKITFLTFFTIGYCEDDKLIAELKNNSFINEKIYSKLLNKNISVLWIPQTIRNLNCNKLLIGDFKYIAKEKEKRISINEVSPGFSTSCSHIKKRGYYPDKPLTLEEEKFPLAFAINVYTDYLKLEQQFVVMYAPQNHYCYAIDKKSSPIFKKKLYSLAKCFPNVYIVKNEKVLDHSGVNGNLYNYECMKLLNDKNYKYLFLLQNDDAPLKTNLELVKILKIYNGTIDMNIGDPIARQPIILDKKKSFKFSSLKMFKKSDKRYNDKILKSTNILIQKGLLQAAISKKTIDYILNEINIKQLLDNLNTNKSYSDELLWPTIFTNPFLQVPGWQHYLCNKKTIFSKYYMTRKTIFSITKEHCPSGFERNGICIFGIESLSLMKKWPHFFANKFRSSFDAGASMCWLQYMYNKKFFSPSRKINENFYLRSPLIKYQKLKETEHDHVKICNMI